MNIEDNKLISFKTFGLKDTKYKNNVFYVNF